MLSIIVWAQTAAWRLKNRMRDENGQTSSEYLVIAGLVVGIIIVIMGVFRKELGTAIKSLSAQVTKSAAGK